MSLIINADAEYLSGSGLVLATAPVTEATQMIWIRRDSGTSIYQSYSYVGSDPAASYNSLWLAHNSTSVDSFLVPSGAQERIIGNSEANSTVWQLLVMVYKQGVAAKCYSGVTGGSLSTITGSVLTEVFNANLDNVRVGQGDATLTGWFARCKLAHHAFWNKALTLTEVTELFNGGTAGAGKNPQAVANANLTFYVPLLNNATVTTGGISLSATGTLTYDGADNPNVDSFGGGGGTAYTIAIDAGTYTITGSVLDTPRVILIGLDVGTYTLTGSDITFGGVNTYTITLDAGSYNISSADPVINVALELDAGTYSTTGVDVILIKTSGGGGGTAYLLPLDDGTYQTTLVDIGVIRTYAMPLDQGTYIVSGKAVRLVSSTEPVIIQSRNRTISISMKIGL